VVSFWHFLLRIAALSVQEESSKEFSSNVIVVEMLAEKYTSV